MVAIEGGFGGWPQGTDRGYRQGCIQAVLGSIYSIVVDGRMCICGYQKATLRARSWPCRAERVSKFEARCQNLFLHPQGKPAL